ncbi:MAG: J domain-containing protein [Nitrospinales bacterium]
MIEAYPLCWPSHWPRNESFKYSRFDTSLYKATQKLLNELRLMGAKEIIISTNIKMKRNGLPYSNYKRPDDPGVSVYFKLKGKPQCIPCDKWRNVEDNIQAIWKTVNALRGIERWGTGKMVEAAFTGFKALPNGDLKHWWSVLEMQESDGLQTAINKYRELALKHHPDQGGDPERMVELNTAIKKAREYYQ